MSKFLIMLSILLSAFISQANTDEPIVVEEPLVIVEEPELNGALFDTYVPFMTCKFKSTTADLSSFVFSVSPIDPTKAMITAVPNKIYFKDKIEELKQSDDKGYDLSNFEYPIVGISSTGVTLTFIDEDTFEINAPIGSAGLWSIKPQKIKLDIVNMDLTFTYFDKTEDVLSCSNQPWLLKEILEIQ